MADFLPNWALLKHPMNWVIVAFSLVILLAITHYFMRDNVTKQPNTNTED